MKISHRLLALGASLGAVASMMTGPLAAQAAVPAPADAGVVAFNTGTAAATVDWVGGSGTYTFNSGCNLPAGLCGDIPPPANTGCVAATLQSPTPGACLTTSNGAFDSVFCGTGFAWSTDASTVINGADTVTASNLPLAAGESLANYDIVFVAGLGVLVAPNVSFALSGSALPGAGAGVVLIAPQGGTLLGTPIPLIAPTVSAGVGTAPVPFVVPSPTSLPYPNAGGPCTNGFNVQAVLAAAQA